MKDAVSLGAFICTAIHDITTHSKPLVTGPIKNESFSWSASDVFVGMGVTIGEVAVVGARVAVYKDMELWTFVGGTLQCL